MRFVRSNTRAHAHAYPHTPTRIHMRTQTCSSSKQTEHSRGDCPCRLCPVRNVWRCAPFRGTMKLVRVVPALPFHPEGICGGLPQRGSTFGRLPFLCALRFPLFHLGTTNPLRVSLALPLLAARIPVQLSFQCLRFHLPALLWFPTKNSRQNRDLAVSGCTLHSRAFAPPPPRPVQPCSTHTAAALRRRWAAPDWE